MRLKTKFQDEYFDLEEVADVDIATMPDGRIKAQARAMRGGLRTIFYKTKAKFDADWEDAPEEPKGIIKVEKSIVPTCIHIECSTEEEAEKAVERLRAWTRLKDTGCKPIMWRWKQDYPNDACYVEVVLKCQFDSGVHDKELDLLFGGEE